MKSLLTIICIVLLNLNLFSQSGWEIQVGGASVNQPFYRDIMFVNGNTGWILTADGIKFTTNNGNNWIDYRITDTSVTTGNCIYFIDAFTGWMLGNKIYKTTNSGQSWAPLAVIYNIKRIFFLNQQSGWCCGINGKLYKTTNGGVNWDSVSTGNSDNFNDVCFVNAQTGFVAADWGKILRTTNAGANWSVFYDNITYSFMQRIKFVDSNTGFVCGSGGYIFKTINAGANWTILNTGSFNVLRDMAFINAQTGYACGMNGGVYRTINGGNYWAQTQSSGLFAGTNGIEVTSTGRLWLITDSSSVYRSDDNASSWTEIYRRFITDRTLYSVRFFNQSTGCACGDMGTIIRTTNGGENWVNINSGTGAVLRSMYLINQLTGFAAGGYFSRNVILKTTNAGAVWFPVNSDSTPVLYSIFFLNPQTGWSCGWGSSNILKTTNGGNYWYKINTSFLMFQLRDIEFVNENTGFLVNNSTFYKTTNGGTVWEAIPNIGNGNTIQFFNETTGYYTGPAAIYRTFDAGNTYNMNLIGSPIIYSMYFVNQSKGWVCGNRNAGGIKVTTNGGLNWVQQNANTTAGLLSIFFINENSGWACGEGGTVIHTSTGGIGINKIGSGIPVNYKLYQNYPNPFNPATKIKFEVPVQTGKAVQITVYDIVGRKVETLLNEILPAGIYEAEFDGTNYSSGVYFCILSAGDFIQSRKMILLK